VAHGDVSRGKPGRRARARTEREPCVEEISGIVARAGIPITSFLSNDLDADYERLVGGGVTFTKELTDRPWGGSQFSTTPAATSSAAAGELQADGRSKLTSLSRKGHSIPG
jgi:hypothetical protein